MEAKQTKNLEELVVLGARIYKGIKQAKADGKIDGSDVQFLLPVFPALGPAINNIDEVVPELADLSVTEKDDLLAVLKSELPELEGDLALIDKISVCLELGIAIKKTVVTFTNKKLV